MKDVGLAADAQTSNASVVDTAIAPTVPSSPRKMQDLLLGFVLSLMGGAGLALALEFFDNSLKTADDTQAVLHLPNLSSIPEFSTSKAAAYLPRKQANQAIESASPADPEICDARSFDSLIGESYRHLRTALLLSRAESPPQVSLVTSALRGEGKTVTAINTAIMLAQFEGRVLLIDGDLRRARCHRLLGMDRAAGLTEVLTGSQPIAQAIRATCVERLHLLSAGVMAPNPTELLASEKMRMLLDDLRGRYQHIVIDSPPVIPVTDAVVLSTLVDGVVLVVGAGRTPKKQVKLACGKLRHARAKIFGTVLNKVHLHSFEYRSYYDYASFSDVQDDVAAN
jgi:capsular exopolysaccharide synthesis family protein